jgi:hypothetical protein
LFLLSPQGLPMLHRDASRHSEWKTGLPSITAPFHNRSVMERNTI